MLAGVAAGIGEHFNVDVTIVRIVFAVLTILGFTGFAYLGGLPLYLGGIPAVSGLLAADSGGRQRALNRQRVPA